LRREEDKSHCESVGSLLSVAESYARMCASAKVSVTTLERLFGGSGSLVRSVKFAHVRLGSLPCVVRLDARTKDVLQHEKKSKRSGRTHSELMNLSVAEIADVSSEIFARMAGEGREARAAR
jgi:hypothetical protein